MGSTDKNRGFTLIEIAIGLIIIGLLTLPLIEMYHIRLEQEKQGFNNAQFSQITESINQYVIDNGFYPAPASLLASPTDNTFGEYGEQATGPFNPCPSWPTPNGVCRTTGPNQILIGAVPTEDLGLNPEFGLDYWGNKILYAVTTSQTVAYSAGAGIVNLQGYGAPAGLSVTLDTPPTGPAVIESKDPVDMILISHGENGAGAYTEVGSLVTPCPVPASGTEFENCNFDNLFTIQEDVIDSALFYLDGAGNVIRNLGGGVATNSQPGPQFYDDYTSEQTSVPVDLWFQHLTVAQYALTLSSRIGVGTEDPQGKVHVEGDLAATAVLSDEVCVNNLGAAEDCFNPQLIAGDFEEMDCQKLADPAHPGAVLNIGQLRVFCASAVDTSSVPLDGEEFEFPPSFSGLCPDGELMQGITASGDTICAPRP